MNTIINQENGVTWISVDEKTLGIVSGLEILDHDGLKFNCDAFRVLETSGADLVQDFERETTTLYCENGRIVFGADGVETIQ